MQHSCNWYAVQTYSRHEKTVAKHLGGDGVETLLPLYQEERKWSDRFKKVDLPLFPGYVFVRLDDFLGSRLAVLRTSGVIGFVGNPREIGGIPENEMSNIRMLVAGQIPCRPHPHITVGQRVRVRSGSLAGLEGILIRVDKDSSLVLSVNLIQRSLSIKIQGYALEAA